jgi:hypothetical protein
MKNAVFWDMAPCSPFVNRRFGGTYRLHLQSEPPAHAGTSLADFSTLKMETIRSSESSVHQRITWRHIPEHGILHGRNSVDIARGRTISRANTLHCSLHTYLFDENKMEDASSSEMLVVSYQMTLCYTPEDNNVHSHCCDNLRSPVL